MPTLKLTKDELLHLKVLCGQGSSTPSGLYEKLYEAAVTAGFTDKDHDTLADEYCVSIHVSWVKEGSVKTVEGKQFVCFPLDRVLLNYKVHKELPPCSLNPSA